MIFRYVLTAKSGATRELSIDPQERGALEKLCAAVDELRTRPGEEIHLSSEPVGPLARVFAEIEATRALPVRSERELTRDIPGEIERREVS